MYFFKKKTLQSKSLVVSQPHSFSPKPHYIKFYLIKYIVFTAQSKVRNIHPLTPAKFQPVALLKGYKMFSLLWCPTGLYNQPLPLATRTSWGSENNRSISSMLFSLPLMAPAARERDCLHVTVSQLGLVQVIKACHPCCCSKDAIRHCVAGGGNMTPVASEFNPHWRCANTNGAGGQRGAAGVGLVMIYPLG